MRCILHSDLNNFYASVECFMHPELRDKYVAVVGDAEARHGIILAKNQAAKSCGIKTGMVIWQARQLCPKLITVGADFPLYLEFSKKVRAIYEDFTDRVESFGIDECWLDVTGSQKLFGTGVKIANTIRERIKEELGLTVSVGVSWNKIFAKIGSDMKKPDAVTVITKENYKDKVWPLDVGDLLFVGRATKRKLSNINIKTIGALAQADIRILRAKLGKWGEYLWSFANGLDVSPVALSDEKMPVKSVGNSLTNYRDLVSNEDVKVLIYLLTESVVSRCRDLNIYKIRTVHIQVRDSNLLSYGRQGQLPSPSLLVNEIASFAYGLFVNSFNWHNNVRGISIAVSGLMGNGNEQLDLLRDENKYAKQIRLEEAIQKIRKVYGNNSVQRASILQDKRLKKIDIKQEHIIHPEGYFNKDKK